MKNLLSTLPNQPKLLALFLCIIAYYSSTAQTGTTTYGTGVSNSGNYNSIFGHYAGDVNSSGYYNSFFGAYAGRNNTTGDYNLFEGYQAGEANTSGSHNVFQGYHAGEANTSGKNNTFVGSDAGTLVTTGSDNVFIGRYTGYNVKTGSKNVLIGYYAGYFEQGSNKLYIDNSGTASPLIYGDFSTNTFKINGTTTLAGNTTVSGNATISGNTTNTGTMTIGSSTSNQAILAGNANRKGLLKIKEQGSGTWSGISIEHTTTSAWSVMGDQDDVGIYDDYNNKWALLYNENNSLDLYYNGSKKFNTSSTGVTVTGTLTATNASITSNLVTSKLAVGDVSVPSGYAVAVEGSILTEEVHVLEYDNWPDYVFEETYELGSLEETEKYIQKNNHLPHVPSAKEVAEEGFDLGDMNATLLRKIEELTLHLIDQNKKIEALQEKVIILENK